MKASMDDLYLFMLTVRHGGISAAATAHGLQRSKISRRLQELEKALHCQLLIRTTRHIELTENGRLLYQHINQPLTEVNHAVNLLESQQNSFQGVLRLAATASFIASSIFAEVLDNYANQFPLVRIELLYLQKSVDLERENIDLQLLPNMAEIINSDYVQQTFLTSSNGLFASLSVNKNQYHEVDNMGRLIPQATDVSAFTSYTFDNGIRPIMSYEQVDAGQHYKDLYKENYNRRLLITGLQYAWDSSITLYSEARFDLSNYDNTKTKETMKAKTENAVAVGLQYVF